MATARPKQARRRAGAASRTRPRATRSAPQPQQPATRHRHELAAIACVALAVFLGFVLYLGWDGGSLGRWLGDASRWLVGLLAFVLPLLLCFVAYVLVARSERRPRRGVSWGIAMMVAAFLLAAAADAFGVFAGERPAALFRDAYMQGHGGFTGEALWALLHPFIGRVGVDVLVLALFLAGVLLATGLVAAAVGDLVAHRRGRRRPRGAHPGRGPRRVAAATRPTRVVPADEDVTVDASDQVRTTRDARGASTGRRSAPTRRTSSTAASRRRRSSATASSLPRPYAVRRRREHAPEPAEQADGGEQLSLAAAAAGEPAGDAGRSPSTRPRSASGRCPTPSALQRLGESAGESPEAIGKVSQRLVETLGHFGDPGARHRHRLRPARDALRAAARARHQGEPRRRRSRTTSPTRWRPPTSACRRRSPASRPSASRCPTSRPTTSSLGDIYGLFPPHASPMAFWLGKDVTGKAVLADLVKMVHLLIAGTTGSGKSGCLNALISSILLRATPDQVRMIMIDPKKVELSNFDGVPHLLAPVVTNMKQATYVLDNICREMDRRYDVLSRNGCQDIRALNKKLARAGEETMPYIMVIIDELADLMMVAPSEVEDSVIRLGQLGRSSGIHLVVATQRPSVDVVTGMIKTNIPSRIAFAVASQTDSRVILDQGGAESLLGMGDMLFSPIGQQPHAARAGRLRHAGGDEAASPSTGGARPSPSSARTCSRTPPAPTPSRARPAPAATSCWARPSRRSSAPAPPRWPCCSGACASGYARAGRLIDIMEEMGIISGYDGSKARSVLIERGGAAAGAREADRRRPRAGRGGPARRASPARDRRPADDVLA